MLLQLLVKKLTVIIVPQATQVVVNEQMYVTILADDTDVCALLSHHYLQQGLQSPMMIRGVGNMGAMGAWAPINTFLTYQ